MLENEHKLEDIKRRLYDKDDPVVNRKMNSTIHPVGHSVEPEWKNDEENRSIDENKNKRPHTSIFKKFFIFSIIFCIGAVGYAYYRMSHNDTSISNDNINIAVIGNAFTKGGEQLPLQIEVTNKNKANLELANLLVSYPNGTSNTTDVTRMPKIAIGTINAGETITKNINVTLYGEEKSDKTITVDLEYHPEGSNAIFTKEIQYVVNISSAPLSINVDSPTEISSDQPFTFKVTATLNTSLPNGDTIMQLTYPNNFVFDSATPAPSFGNSVWSLDGLTTSNPITVQVNGRLIGQDKDQQVFHVYTGTAGSNDKSTVKTVYNSALQTITIVKPFIEATINVDNYVSSGDTINGKIDWANNLSTKITDAQIILNVSSNAFDRSQISSFDGYFDSVNNRIIWDKNSNPELADVEPGAKGEVNFSVGTVSTVGEKSSLNNPQVVLDVSIKGNEPSLGNTYNEVNNFSKKIVKLLSDFQIASSATYNSGAFPPEAEKETQYNVTWTLSNTTNAISNAEAKSVLPTYISWVGSLSQGEDVSYNPATREVIWNIGNVRANTGSVTNREAMFTISLTPSTAQVGSIPQLMKDLTLTGHDTYTDTDVKSTRGAINTSIPGDPHFHSGDERVIQ